jgi:hypothetical protein
VLIGILENITVDDTINIRSISGLTSIYGGSGNDYINVNAGLEGERMPANGIGAVLNLDGESDTDRYTINLGGTGAAIINVQDTGAPDAGSDVLIINGLDSPSDPDPDVSDDNILLRKKFVARLNDPDADGEFQHVERINYDEAINGRLIVNGLGGNDRFYIDDNSAITTVMAGPVLITSRSDKSSVVAQCGGGVLPGDD